MTRDSQIARDKPMTAVPPTPLHEPVSRWWLLWTLYGLPRCSQAVYPFDSSVIPCYRLIWPWQPRETRSGAPVHVSCLTSEVTP